MEVRPTAAAGKLSCARDRGQLAVCSPLAYLERFGRVTVVERDNFSREPVPRKGIRKPATHTSC